MTRTLLTGGIVLSQDERIGDLEEGDVLIEGDTIVDVGPRLDVTDAEVVDVRGQIVLPGFVDTHRHMWQGAIGGLASTGTLASTFGRCSAPLPPTSVPKTYMPAVA